MNDKLIFLPINQRIVNRTLLWYGGDSPETYKKSNRLGRNLYDPAPSDISYKFNERGFRSDSFSDKSEFGVVFVGCSQTAGVGLPLRDMWAYRLLERIREKTGKNIPYWSIAQPGAGLDTNAHDLYLLDQLLAEKPVMVICLAAPWHRREIMYNYQERRLWVRPGSFPLKQKVMDELFSDEWFGRYQLFRSCMTIDLLVKSWNSKFYLGMWDNSESTIALDFLIDAFPNFNRVDISSIKKHNTDFARDSVHWGPSMNAQLVEDYWKIIEPDIEALM